MKPRFPWHPLEQFGRCDVHRFPAPLGRLSRVRLVILDCLGICCTVGWRLLLI